MRGSKGSILAITMGFTLIFTMLGTASIYISTLHTETQEKQILSQQAFWLAEAGVNKAISLLPSTTPFNGNLGNGSYNVPTISVSGINQWTIDSIGTAQNQNRHIQVEVFKLDTSNVDSPITCNGGEDDNCVTQMPNSTINGVPAEEGQVLDFFTIFGVTMESVYAAADNIYTGNQNNPLPVDDITWVAGDLRVQSGWRGSGLLIVDGDMRIDGGIFDGIIWVTGNIAMINAASTNINGAIFVEGTEEIKVTGDATVGYDSGSVADAGTVILAWREIT